MTDALIAARLVHFASVMALFGATFFPFYAVRADAAAGQWFMSPRSSTLVLAGLLALLSALGWLATVVANMTGDWMDVTDSEVVRSALFETAFGQVWTARLILILIILAFALFRSLRTSEMGRRVFLLLTGILLASLALTGHAAAHKGFWGDVHRFEHAIHLLAGGAWLGGLAPLAAILGLARRSASQAAIAWAGTVVRRFSMMGYWAVALILLTGIMNSVFLVGGVSALFSTPYGQVLLAKVALVLVMVSLALWNRLILAPRLPAVGAVAALWRSVMAELAFGLGVLALASFLGTLIPALYHEG